MTVAHETEAFRASRSVVVALDAPVTGRVVEALRDVPYAAIELDMALVRELSLELGSAQSFHRRSRPTARRLRERIV